MSIVQKMHQRNKTMLREKDQLENDKHGTNSEIIILQATNIGEHADSTREYRMNCEIK